MNPDTIINELLNFTPSVGDHPEGSQELCAMEYVAFLAGEKHSDSPECACPVIAAYVRALNDNMPDQWRYKLRGYLLRLIGNRDPAHERERAEYLAFQAGRVFAPIDLRKAGMEEHAVRLEACDTLAEVTTAAQGAAGAAAGEARAAAWGAAGEARDARDARAAAWAARAAAKAAARAAAWHAALDALDGVLAIGKQADEAPADLEERVREVGRLVEQVQ